MTAFEEGLAKAMMQWHGSWPKYIPSFDEADQEQWGPIEMLRDDPTEAARVRDQHREHAIQSAAYANVLQMVLNDEAGKPLLAELPFPLPDGCLTAEVADAFQGT